MTSVIFDMDGVLYCGSEPLPDAPECIETLRNAGFKTGFLTNNSGRSREERIELLKSFGINAEVSEMMTSGEATARYLNSKGYKGARVYVVGKDGLVETLKKAGFEIDLDDAGPRCDLVVVGWARNINFEKIARAQYEIFVNKAGFFATNVDPMFPSSGGKVLPGAGSMVAAIATASASTPEVIGKPKTISLKYLLMELGVEKEPPESVWMVGDRLDSDIACGNSYGAHTVLVTTGIASREMGEKAVGIERPEFIIDSLSELPTLILEKFTG